MLVTAWLMLQLICLFTICIVLIGSMYVSKNWIPEVLYMIGLAEMG